MADTHCSKEEARLALRRKLCSQHLPVIDYMENLLKENISSLDVSIDTVETSPNQLSHVLTIARKVKIYFESTGPLDAVKMVIDSNLCYCVYIFCEVLIRDQLSAPHEITSLPVLQQIKNESEWTVCHGVSSFSSYNQYCTKDAVHMVLPHDSVRHIDCSRLFKSTSNKSVACHSCQSLKYYLTSRKRRYDALSEEDLSQRQSSSSTVPIDYLSPVSRTKRVHNMRRTISQLQRKLHSINQVTVELRDEQNDEMMQLVKGITESENGQTELKKIYEEADTMVGDGRGAALKHIWSNDVEMFYKDQSRCGKFFVLLPQFIFI